MSTSSAPNPAPLLHRLSSRLDDLAALARAVDAWCRAAGVPGAEAQRLTLMIDELVTNTVLHGYRGREDGWIEVRLARAGDVVHVVLSDGAPHFDPTARRPVKPAEDLDELVTRPLGGLGVDFVRRLVQRWQHQALPGGGNRLQLWRRIDSRPGND